MLEIYKNIKKYRKMMGLSQEELAKLAGYTDRSSIAKIEKGDVDLPQSKIRQFAEIFGIPAGDLMGNDGVLLEVDERAIGRFDKLRDDVAPGLSTVMKIYQMLDQEDRDEILALMRYKLSKYQ